MTDKQIKLKQQLEQAKQAVLVAKEKAKKAEQEYIASFGVDVGDFVQMKDGRKGWVYDILVWDSGGHSLKYYIKKLKKNGQKSRTGIIEYLADQEDFEVIKP